MIENTWHYHYFFLLQGGHFELILFWTLLDALENKRMLFFRVNIIFVFDGHKYLASLYLYLFIILCVCFETVSVV